MKSAKNNVAKKCLILAVLVTVLTIFVELPHFNVAATTLSFTAAPDKSSYYIREPIRIGGTLLENGQPATDYLVSVEVRNERGTQLLFRTVPMGNPSQRWAVEITEVYIKDSWGKQTDSVALNSMVRLYATVHNTLLSEYNVVVTGTVFDGNLVPIFAIWDKILMPSSQTRTFSWTVSVPEWAYSGKALAVINAYSDLPGNGGMPFAPEAQYIFYMTRNPEMKYPYSTLPATYTSGPGEYSISFRMPPDRYTLPGNYATYVTALSTVSPVLRSSNSTFFNLNQYSSPPQAAFTFTPLQVYANMTVTFDGSSSSAEGYNDTIVRYDWLIDDPYNPAHIIKTGNFTNPPNPTVTHVFRNPGTYVVQLNVTDNEGLWSTTSKPVIVSPEFGPTAIFTVTPPSASANQTVTFNASQSLTGWSAQLPGFAPIVNYTWNFNDGSPINTTSSDTTTHKFTQPGNFTVTLTIIDSVSRTSFTSQLVQVTNSSIYDLNHDGKIDMRDISIVARAFGARPGNPLWNPIADINGDGVVDMKDIAPVARHFGEGA